MKTRRLLLVMLAMAGTFADGVDNVAAADNPCAAETDTSAMLNCLNRRDQELDGELERSYSQLVSGLSAGSAGNELQRLESAQKAWKAYREAQLRFIQGMTADAGTMAPLLYLQDKISMTEHRIEQLKDGAHLAQ
jgi:uncharacterized protein YecT (DUF1311 family)